MKISGVSPNINCPCSSNNRVERILFDAKPEGETDFGISKKDYKRYFDQCTTCHHWFGRHNLDLSEIYSGKYVEKTYGNKLKEVFDKIINLSPGKSDNVARANRIDVFTNQHFQDNSTKNLLDIGSGTGVFPHEMKKLGWECTALDPDKGACEHISENVGIETLCGDFLELTFDEKKQYSLVTLNKVLEHVETPSLMLEKARKLLINDGLLYVEVPDGDSAFAKDPKHEEFFIEHHHAFSMASLALLVARSGFSCLELRRINEPSGKFTIYCFAKIVK